MGGPGLAHAVDLVAVVGHGEPEPDVRVVASVILSVLCCRALGVRVEGETVRRDRRLVAVVLVEMICAEPF